MWEGLGTLGRLVAGAARVVWGGVRDALGSKRQLVEENAALRAQVVVLKRQVRRAAPRSEDRLLLAGVAACVPRTLREPGLLLAVRPETVVRWHRELARLRWRFLSRRRAPSGPRRRLDPEVPGLVRDMAEKNGIWGARRIVGELKKLGHRVSKRTVQRILRKLPRPDRPAGQAWATFVRNHLAGTWAADFFTVTTVGFRQLYVFFAIDLATRRVLDWEITEHPTREWVTQQARNAVWDGAPQRLIRDRDGKYGAQFDEVFTSSGAEVLRTPPQQPVANAFAERMVLTFRRELFDRVVPRDEEHTRWLLERYVAHFNEQRPHQGIEQRIPAELARDAAERPRDGPVVVTPVLNGLIHAYARALRPAA